MLSPKVQKRKGKNLSQDRETTVFKIISGRAQWLTTLIPGFWEAKAGRLLEPKSSRPAWATG